MTSEREAARAARRIDQGPAIEEIEVRPGQIIRIGGHEFRVKPQPVRECELEAERQIARFHAFPLWLQHTMMWLGCADAWLDPGTTDEREAAFWRATAWGLLVVVALVLGSMLAMTVMTVGRHV